MKAEEISNKLYNFENGNFEKVPEEEVNDLMKNLTINISEWKKRRRVCMEMVNQFAESMDKKPAEIIELIDLETDEQNNVKIPNIPV